MMIIVMGTARFRPGTLADYRDAMAAQVAATEAEDGCIQYRFSVDVTDPDLLHITEQWRDQAALTAHFTAPHMAVFNAALADAKPLSIDVKAYDAPGGPRPLAG